MFILIEVGKDLHITFCYTTYLYTQDIQVTFSAPIRQFSALVFSSFNFSLWALE